MRRLFPSFVLVAGCATTATPAPATVTPDAPAGPVVARLTGGVGNRVVTSFDEIRLAVRGVQGAIDRCYVDTANDGGWRENLTWDLDVAANGSVTRVALHPAEYWRGDVVVAATPTPKLAECMERALGAIVFRTPVHAGSIRVRFES